MVREMPEAKERVSEKHAAIGEYCKEFWGAVRNTSDEVWGAAGKMWADVSKFQSVVQAQVKENEEAVTKISEEIKRLSRDLKSYVRDFW